MKKKEKPKIDFVGRVCSYTLKISNDELSYMTITQTFF